MKKKIIKLMAQGIFFLIFSCAPIILWLLAAPIAYRFNSAENIWRSIGQLSGLLGMSLFAESIILSTRIKAFNRWFYGLDLVYIAHHWLGTISFCLLLIHPLALAARLALVSLPAAAFFLIPSDNLALLSGIIALLGMMFLLLLTYFFNLAYHRWLLTHKFLALVFAVAYVHFLLIPSDTSVFMPLRYYFYFLGALTLLSIVYRVIFSKKLVRHFRYKISAIRKPYKKIFDIDLAPIGLPMPCRGGQFAFFKFLNESLKQDEHPFSFSGIYKNGGLRITVKSLGDETDKFNFLKIGDEVLVEGPYGGFGQNLSQKQLWLAGGIGITPFLSLAQELSKEKDVILIRTMCRPEEDIFYSDFSDVTKVNHSFREETWCSDNIGFITANDIAKKIPDWKERDILLCGPVQMMEDLKKQFIALGGKSDRLINENFNFK